MTANPFRSLKWSALGAAIVSGFLACAHAPFCKTEGELYPEKPFTLEVILSASRANVGSRLSVQYVLTNSAGNAVGACLDGWDNFHLIGSRGNRGGIHVSTAVALDDVVRLAPGTSLVWTREVEVPDVGLGKAQFIGIVESRCWLWSGRVMSRPVEIEIVGAS